MEIISTVIDNVYSVAQDLTWERKTREARGLWISSVKLVYGGGPFVEARQTVAAGHPSCAIWSLWLRYVASSSLSCSSPDQIFR
jgi:hypothetical protein